ncbi:MAG: helix-turn-helix domain-containing protein [Ruminococcaceae bacterium]|nr:helix-turn-helix domain-containing protein [Oscillospiraceae bacterium]
MIHKAENVIKSSEFPFAIYDAHGQSDALSDNPYVHKHDSLEVNYIVSGKGYYLYNNQKYELHPGDIYIINNHEYHMAYNEENLFLKVIVFNADLVWNGNQIDYSFLKAFFERGESDRPFLRADEPVAKELVPIILNIEKEWTQKDPGYRMFIKTDLMKLLGIVYRYYESEKRFEHNYSNSSQNHHHAVIRVVDHINAHYWEHLSLEEMADMVHMSKNYFSKLFSETMKMPFSSYVLEKRLNHACILLKTTDNPITDVAVFSGFDTVSYFNKAFKKRYGQSPGFYRTIHKPKA